MGRTVRFLYSPLSPSLLSKPENRSLLLELILRELIQSDYLVQSAPVYTVPFDWGTPFGTKNKVEEYALVLADAFPSLQEESASFARNLDRPCAQLLVDLDPFIILCSEEESFLFFLIKNQKSVSIKSVLDRIFPRRSAFLKKFIKDRYRARGLVVSQWT